VCQCSNICKQSHVPNQICIRSIRSRLKAGHVSYPWDQNILSYILIPTAIKAEIYRAIILPVFCMGLKLGLSHWLKYREGLCWGTDVGLRETRWQENGDNNTVNNFTTCTSHQTLLPWSDQRRRDGRAIYYMWGRRVVDTRLWWVNLRERDHLKDPDINGKIILFQGKGWAWTEMIFLMIGTVGRLLWTRWWTFGFYGMRGISWMTEELYAFQKAPLLNGVSRLVSYTYILSILDGCTLHLVWNKSQLPTWCK